MVVNLQKYKESKQKDIKRIITDEENYEISVEMNILQTVLERKKSFNYSLKLVK